MSEKQAPYTPYYHMETGFAQLAAMDMAMQLEDKNRKLRSDVISFLRCVIVVQLLIIFLLVVFG
jgi:hypothetical protein